MTFYKSALALAISSVLSATALAQTQNIPVPASSINGGRAVVAITIPAASALPSDICTASNGNCATMAGVQQGIYGGSIVIPNQGGGKAWTTYFLNTSKTVSLTYGGNATFAINSDGTISTSGYVSGGGSAPTGNSQVAYPSISYCNGSNLYNVGSFTVGPVFASAFDQTPISWSVSPSLGMSYSTCGGNDGSS